MAKHDDISGYGLVRPCADIAQITLPKPGLPRPYGTPVNLFVISSDIGPSLVGSGHPRSMPSIRAALARLGLEPSDIVRVVAMDWSPDQVGAAEHYPNADLLLCSDAMDGPGDYKALIDRERTELRDAVEYVLGADLCAGNADPRDLDRVLDLYLGDDLPDRLDFVPLRTGHTLRLGARSFRVIELGGTGPGHMILYESKTLVFAGKLLVRRPDADPQIRDGGRTGEGLDRLSTMDAPLALSSIGRPERDMKWVANHATRSFVNLVTSLPMLIKEPMTAGAVASLNLGYKPRHVVRFAESMRTMTAYLEECVRAGKVSVEGTGFGRTFHGHDSSDRLMRW